MNLNYNKIEKDHNPLLNNFYIYDNGKEIAGLMVVSKMEDKLYLIDFRNVEIGSKEFNSYLSGNLQDKTNEDASWYWTKYLLKYMDEMLTKEHKQVKIKSLDEIFNYKNENEVILFEIDLNDFKDAGYVYEMVQDDLLEMVSKLIHKDKETPFLDEKVRKDLNDTQGWLLETIFDNN